MAGKWFWGCFYCLVDRVVLIGLTGFVCGQGKMGSNRLGGGLVLVLGFRGV